MAPRKRASSGGKNGVNIRSNSVNANDCVSRNDTSGGNAPVEDRIGAVDVNKKLSIFSWNGNNSHPSYSWFELLWPMVIWACVFTLYTDGRIDDLRLRNRGKFCVSALEAAYEDCGYIQCLLEPYCRDLHFKLKQLNIMLKISYAADVSEKHGLSGSSGGPPSAFKVLRLLNEQNGAEQSLQLWDDWYSSVVAPGDTVLVVGELDSQGKCDVNDEKNFFIVHPDILVSGTRVSASFSCPRRTVLDERIKSTENSTAALIGTLLHQIFQAGLISEPPTKEYLEEYARTVLHKSLENLYACGENENDIFKTMIAAIPKILNWISSFRDSQGSKSPTVDFKCDEGLKGQNLCGMDF
ncbi:hypothetical protein SASPL_147542 [Salvia splendens]|uniref:DNA replication factor Dna2 N-terminal domain-containing protein n=1 Tax=Salvia splendens TaxID=180675 RepID=A0A8X8WET1_SALSN|nr:hypothetical protein SASPL_147542 [Salvia splendens]